MAETPPASARRPTRARAGGRAASRARGNTTTAAAAAAAAATTAPAARPAPNAAAAAAPVVGGLDLLSTTPMAPPPAVAPVDMQRKSSGRKRAGDGTSSPSGSASRRQSGNRRRRTSRRVEQITSSSDDEPELDLPDDHEPPRPDEAPVAMTKSLSRRLWQVIANSPRWIREQGRGSDSETDSETEVLREIYQRRRVSGPYWLRPDVHAPRRLTYAENQRIRRRRRMDAMHDSSEFPYMSGSDYDDDDLTDDGAIRRRRGEGRGDGDDDAGSAFGDDWGDVPYQDLGNYPDHLPPLPDLPGLDQLPPDASMDEIAKLLPKQSRWRRFRKGLRVYVRKPGLRLLKWILLRILFALFAVYWIIKEAFLLVFRFVRGGTRDYVWRPMVKVLGTLFAGPLWVLQKVFGTKTKSASPAIGMVVIASFVVWLVGPRHLVSMFGSLSEPRTLDIQLPEIKINNPFSFGWGSSTLSSVLDPSVEKDLIARLATLEKAVGDLLSTTRELDRRVGEAVPSVLGGNGDHLSADAKAAIAEARHLQEEISTLRHRLSSMEIRSKDVNQDLEAMRNAILPKEAVQHLNSKLSDLTADAETVREKLRGMEQRSSMAQERMDVLGRNVQVVRDQLVAVQNRQSEPSPAASSIPANVVDWTELERYLERHLPARFLKNGELRVDDALKAYLEKWLQAHAPLHSATESSGAAKVDWAQLLNEHQGDLDRIVRARVERSLREAKAQGEVIDREAVLSELRRRELQEGSGWRGLFGADDIKGDQVQVTVRRELDRYHADGLAIPDYALLAAGARVVPRLTSDTFTPGPGSEVGRMRRIAWWFISQFKSTTSKPPSVALLPWRQPGDCWPMAGHSGRLTVHLARAIIPEAITLEHVDRRIALDASSSPREVIVYAVAHDVPDADRPLPVKDAAARADGAPQQPKSMWKWDRNQRVWTKPLTRFIYQLDGPAAQTIQLAPDMAGFMPVRLMQLHVLSNYGQSDFTCLYRFRVHGRPAPDRPAA
ncbi:hypothetical protein THASP1DRAFT_31609 [Thamnocephalis sphaerospora]|uniref:SUN domain-containing protein n=1 Tax=Thamnocephalis sphaerospora TaxID=78915 RepID=A0A4P9XMH9_9FUNG|nr:hypothetical protein THASP1DRAFT_31609 [Thamnocephalis sphaerospora]|eukprot:RKP06581.1 hypothetical protein THASP1DRAFT_31609 [Thamnocephalis sphaerospora]